MDTGHRPAVLIPPPPLSASSERRPGPNPPPLPLPAAPPPFSTAAAGQRRPIADGVCGRPRLDGRQRPRLRGLPRQRLVRQRVVRTQLDRPHGLLQRLPLPRRRLGRSRPAIHTPWLWSTHHDVCISLSMVFVCFHQASYIIVCSTEMLLFENLCFHFRLFFARGVCVPSGLCLKAKLHSCKP